VTRPFVLAVRHYTKKPGCVACFSTYANLSFMSADASGCC
jgi:hypothetical protein